MSSTIVIPVKMYCKTHQTWCVYANDGGYCKCTACIMHYDQKTTYSTGTDYSHTYGGTYAGKEQSDE